MVGGSEAIQVTEVNPIQFIKEKLIFLTLLGIVMEDKLEQLANTALPISSTLFPMITVCKFAQ